MTAADPHRLRSGEVLDRARAANRAALLGYLPVGYPDLERSIEAARSLSAHGATMTELSPPYSAPVTDGPLTHQAASAALAGGTPTRHVLEAVRALSGRGAAILVMSYWNPILAHGPEAFARDLA